MTENKTRHARWIRQRQPGQRQPRQHLVGCDGDNERVVRVARRLAERGPIDFDLGVGVEFEALDQQQIYRGHPRYQFSERRLLIAAQFVLQGPAAPRGDHDLACAGLAVTPRILTRLIEIERVVRVLDGRNRDPASDQLWYQRRHQRCFAAAAPPGNAEDLHCQLTVSMVLVRRVCDRASRERKKNTPMPQKLSQ